MPVRQNKSKQAMKNDMSVQELVDHSVPNYEEWFAQISVQEYKADYATFNQNIKLKEIGAL
jgi:hypothetical protein